MLSLLLVSNEMFLSFIYGLVGRQHLDIGGRVMQGECGLSLWGWQYREESECAKTVALQRVSKQSRLTAAGPVVERVHCSSLDAKSFNKYRDAPVVLTGCSVPSHLTTEYLSKQYGDKVRNFHWLVVSSERQIAHKILRLKVVPVEINSSTQQAVRLADYLAFTNGELSKHYLRNLHVCRWFPEEMAHLSVPPCLGDNLLGDPSRTFGVPDEWRNWFELFVSSPDCPGFPVLHIDVCSIHAFSMQLSGVKRFTVFPPEDTARLYPLPPANTASQLPRDLNTVDLEQFPAFADAHATHVDLQPGEVLYVPAGWWHTAKTVGSVPSVTVAGSFVGEDNIDRFLDDYGDFAAMQSLVSRGAASLK